MTNLVLISMSTATVTAAALRYIWADVLFLCNAMLHVCGACVLSGAVIH